MRIRPAARLIILCPEHRVLLFRFSHRHDALAGQCYWATPGGGLEANESFEQAALRELREETGVVRTSPGAQIARRSFTMQLPSGESVQADERFYLIESAAISVDRSGWSDNERRVIRDSDWWSLEALRTTPETIFPRALIIEIMQQRVAGMRHNNRVDVEN